MRFVKLIGSAAAAVSGVAALAAVVVVASSPHTAYAGSGFVAYGVSAYDAGAGCGGAAQSATGGVNDANHFASKLASNGWTLQGGVQPNGSVNDTDFYDPNISGFAYDNDTNRFDPAAGTFSPNVAISYYAGHGGGTPNNYDVHSCTHDSDCPALVPPTPYWGAGICTYCPTGDAGLQDCLGTSHAGPGVCRYAWKVNAIIHGGGTHHLHCNEIQWGNQTGGILFGESANSGPWADPFENGGTNMVVFHQSFGGTPGLWGSETQSIFGGLHLLGMTSPTSSDTGVNGGSSDLGAAFAATASNPASVVGDDFVGTVATIPYGQGCPQGNPNPAYARGGYNGCGCNTVISWDANAEAAAFHVLTENWNGLADDGHDATGTGYYEWLTQCNYDQAVYPYLFSNP